MKERLLHFIWQHKLFNIRDLLTEDGNSLQIINFGKINNDGGPDFFNATIKIDNIVLVGNIELHVYASDWILHKHNNDKKYKNVILHVVYFNDVAIPNIPTLVLNGLIPPILIERYSSMLLSKQLLICKPMLSDIDEFSLLKWKERLLIERLERKSAIILHNLNNLNNDWEQVCYRLLGKYFGSHINNDNFERLTQYLDCKILSKHANDITQLEAMIFGVAGFLNADFVDEYPLMLKREYLFLKHKYKLQEVETHSWQFLRIRPISFPTIRLAWFAQLMQKLPLFQLILSENIKFDFMDNIQTSVYWETHYTFDKISSKKNKHIGNDFKSMLCVNVIAPLVYAYGKWIGDEKWTHHSIQILMSVAAEQNSKTKHFFEAGLKQYSAYDSQAFIELQDNYCTQKRCLDCSIGYTILNKNIPKYPPKIV